MNFYKRHIGDYLKDTAHLSLLEHGVYTRLLDVYYTREAGLPEAQVARLIGARSKDEGAALAVVLDEFFSLVDGIWIQDRCEREIEEASAQAKANRENGKKGGRPKKSQNPEQTQTETEKEPNENPSGFVSITEKNLSQTPDSRLQTKPLEQVVIGGSPTRELTDDFSPRNESEWLRHLRAKHGFEADPTDVNDRKRYWQVFARWINAGIKASQIDAAIAKAHADSSEPISNIVAYADRVLVSMTVPPKVTAADAKSESRRRAYEVLTGKTSVQSEVQPAEVINGHVKLLG